ncbi:MAG: glycosyl hydrolase family 8 [Chlorobiaceae bacterium]
MKIRAFVLLFSLLQLLMIKCSTPPVNPEEIVRSSWTHYKRTFIRAGRVVRPANNMDTVSEGESYAMLRAVLMGDRTTFDECLAWSESVLSRKTSHGDRLLAWHFENGKISDTTAASDADIDYAYSLVLAYRRWHYNHYIDLAREVLKSILDHETALVNGRLYLIPSTLTESRADKLVAQNPSYYSPSSFKVFYEVSGDERWLELADTTYHLLGKLQVLFGDRKKSGLVPDWCALDPKEKIVVLPGKSLVYGWDALRVPLRIAADYHLNKDPRALAVLQKFSLIFENEFKRSGKIFSEYSCDNQSLTTDENPLFYTAAYAATDVAGSSLAPDILTQQRRSIRQNERECYYNETDDYYVNSLAWLVEYYQLSKGLHTSGT